MTQRSRRVYAVRPLEKCDIPAIAGWFGDIEGLASFDRVSRVPLSRTASEEAWAEAIGNAAGSGKYWFAIDGEDAAPVGIVGLESVSPINRDAVIPLYIVKGARSRGIGLRAVALVLDLGFRQLGLNRVTSYYRADNEASRRLTARVGFAVEGRMRQAWFCDGRFIDMIVVGLLRDEWTARRETLARELDPATTVGFRDGGATSWAWPPPARQGAEAPT